MTLTRMFARIMTAIFLITMLPASAANHADDYCAGGTDASGSWTSAYVRDGSYLGDSYNSCTGILAESSLSSDVDWYSYAGMLGTYTFDIKVCHTSSTHTGDILGVRIYRKTNLDLEPVLVTISSIDPGFCKTPFYSWTVVQGDLFYVRISFNAHAGDESGYSLNR